MCPTSHFLDLFVCLFGFWVIPGAARRSLLTLHSSGIIPGGARGTLRVARDPTRSSACKENALPTMLSFQPPNFFFFFCCHSI